MRPPPRTRTGGGVRARACGLLLCGLLGLAAVLADPAYAAEGAEDGTRAAEPTTVYVTNTGWHAGIAVPADALPPGRIPEAAAFPEARYLEIGWGDADYYPDPEAGALTALGAAFGDSPAVIHLAGLPRRPDRLFPEAEVVGLTLAPDAFRALVGYLHDGFDRDGADRAEPVAPGLYDFSRFYPATGAFSLSNTCNTWAARGLAAAGLPVDPDGVVQAGDLMRQIRPLAHEAPGAAGGETGTD